MVDLLDGVHDGFVGGTQLGCSSGSFANQEKMVHDIVRETERCHEYRNASLG
jgi:hypothetical protein